MRGVIEGKEYTMINSVLKAIDILNLFTTSEPRLSLAEISHRQGLPKTTAHNLLKTLLSQGFVEKTDDGRYALGTAIIALTQSVRVNVELRDGAAPLLRELADACRESVYLCVPDDGWALYIYAIESPGRLRARTAVGDRACLHCTSLGKAILSRLSKEEVDGIVDRRGLPRFTDLTITDRAALHRELEQIRAQGYAIDKGEHEIGLYCIGAPILNKEGRVVGACSVSGQDPDIIQGKLEDCSTRVMYAAQEISRRLGYVPDSLSALASVPMVTSTTEVTR
jgi:DNA-binding IclR family transcriptional regulator